MILCECFLHHVGFLIDRHSYVARSTEKVSEQNVNEAGKIVPLRFYRAFQKHAKSEAQKPTVFAFFAAVNHLRGPLRKQSFT